MDQGFRTTRGEYGAVKNRYSDNYSGGPDPEKRSLSLVGEERGYVLGVEDERKRFREKMKKIIANLKARGYPLTDIAEDTGYSLEEIRVI